MALDYLAPAKKVRWTAVALAKAVRPANGRLAVLKGCAATRLRLAGRFAVSKFLSARFDSFQMAPEILAFDGRSL